MADDREILLAAMDVIERRWPHGRPTVDLLRNWAEAIEEEDEVDGGEPQG